jgi:hypothetical protein
MLGDGSVRMVRKDINLDVHRRAETIADGEPVSHSEL